MTPTHDLKLADGYGSTPCQLLAQDRFLATVRVRDSAYWEADKFTTRVVRVSSLSAIN